MFYACLIDFMLLHFNYQAGSKSYSGRTQMISGATAGGIFFIHSFHLFKSNRLNIL